jgi:WD40 repeat protein
MLTIQTGFRSIDHLAISHDGQRLAAAGNQNEWTVEVWDLTTSELVGQTINPEPFAFGLALDPLTGGIFTGDAKDGVFADDGEGGEVLEVPGGPLRSFAISGDGKWLVCGCEFWEATGRRHPDLAARLVGWKRKAKGGWSEAWQAESDGYSFEAITFLPGGKQLVAVETLASGGRRRVAKLATRITLRDTRTGRELQQSAAWAGKPADQVVLCESFVVARGGEGQVFAWNLDAPGEPPLQVPTGRQVSGLAAHPDGQLLATTSGDQVVFWDAPSWQRGKTFAWKAGSLRTIAFSPDGMLAAVSGAKGRVIVWDLVD